MDNSDDLGLNIVAVPATAKVVPKKKKKNNKFEKRRRRAARERQAKLELKQQGEAAATTATDAPTEEINDEPNGSVEKIIPVRPREHLEDAYPEQFPTDKNDATAENDDGDDDNKPPLARSTAHLPQDEQERAAYLAEFHARPLELDRRAGALRKVTASKNSAHLFAAVRTWADCGLSERLIQAVQSNAHFDLAQPTMIQAKAIPVFLKKDGQHNILLHSETGSGKTLSYLLPIVQALAVSAETGQARKMDRQQVGTRCLILCPTRELASQTFQVVERLCTNSYNWLVPGSLLGEENRKSEKARLRKGLAIIVATPGRLLDHLQKTESLLMALKGKLEWLVLDEADRLLDMGLGGQVKQIVQRIRSNQPGSGPQKNGITWRSALVSATVTNTVQALAKETMVGMDSTWEWVRASEEQGGTATEQNESEASTELAASTPRQLSQAHMTVSAKFRLSALIALLVKRVEKKERAVVFFNTCASVDYHHALLSAMDSILDQTTEEPPKGIFGTQCRIFKLHGSVSHTDRQHTIRQFLKPHKNDDTKETEKAAILLATDVAARGLNLQNCDWTIQYDPPSEVSDYVHRAGRVARAGRAGHSLLFLLPSERPYLDVLKQRGIKHLPAISLASTLDAAAKICSGITKEGVKHSGGGLGQSKQAGTRAGEAFCSELQRRCEYCVKQDDEETRRAHQAKRKEERKAGIRSGPVNGELLELARAAFLSHIRAYPTREKAVKHIFSARALHLGHVARAFALSEPPKRLASKTKTHGSKSTEAENKKRSAALAFQDSEDGQEMKKTEPSPSKKGKGPHEIDTRKNRALMIANASKLNGLDSL